MQTLVKTTDAECQPTTESRAIKVPIYFNEINAI